MGNKIKKVYLLENPNAGLTSNDEEINNIIKSFLKKGINVERLSSKKFSTPESFHKLCKDDQVEILITNGGDGTVNYILPYLIDSNISLLPLQGGTFNHFARHVGIPSKLDEALDLLFNGNRIKVDVGEVNSHPFINFATIGFYAEIIRNRKKLQKYVPKWVAFFISLIRTFSRYRSQRISFSFNSEDYLRTPLLFVGNNRFNFGSADILKRREDFMENVLHIGVFKDITKAQLALFIWRAMTVDINKYLDFKNFKTQSLIVKTDKPVTTVTLDGEVFSLKTPLIFGSRPRALSVIVPR